MSFCYWCVIAAIAGMLGFVFLLWISIIIFELKKYFESILDNLDI